MFGNHWCVRSTYNGLKSQMHLDDPTPTQPPDLGKPQEPPQSYVLPVGKGNGTRQNANRKCLPRAETQWVFVPTFP